MPAQRVEWMALYQLRRSRGWDRHRLAAEIGCSYRLICGVESGRLRVTEQLIDRLCGVFDITDTWELERTLPPAQRAIRAGRLAPKVAS